MRDSAPSTDDITKTLIVAGGEDTIDMRVFIIQNLWETDCRQWDLAVSDSEVCMLYKGKGSRKLPQNQRFIMLITFGLRVKAKIVARLLTRHREENSLIVKEQYGFRSMHSVLGPILVLIFYIEDAVRAKFSPGDDHFTSIFAHLAKGYPNVPRPELMAVMQKSGIPPRFSNIIRGLMEHARYRVTNNVGHSKGWFNMNLGLKEGCPAAPIEFSMYHFFISKDLKSRLLGNPRESVRVGFSSEEFNDLEHPPTKKVTWRNTITNTLRPIDLLLFSDDTTYLCRLSEMQNREADLWN